VPWLIALVVSLAWLFGPTIEHLVGEWGTSADSSYGLVLAVVACAIMWRRRSSVAQIAAEDSRLRPLGLLLFAAGLLLFLAGQLAADVFVSRVSLVVVLAGIVWYCAGVAALRQLSAPFAFLLIAIPLPALVVNAITLPLQLVASRIAELTLTALSVPVFREGNLLALPSSTLEVAEACSGLRSLVSLAAIAAMLAWTMRRGATARAVLVASTVPIAVVMNGLRIAVTGLMVESWGPAFGKGGWHELTGWLTFVASLAVLLAVKRVLTARRWMGQKRSTRAAREGLAAA
jgi:exosortase